MSASEQRLFRRLSVFAGGWGLQISEAVCDFDGTLGIGVFDGISSLIENSLVREEDDPQGEPRYSMLESIHEYARERLEDSNEARTVGQRHAEVLLELAERADRDWIGEEIAADDYPGGRLAGEIPNLRAALQRAIDDGELEFALRFIASAHFAWWISGRLTEGRSWLTRVLDLSADRDSRERAMAEEALAQLEYARGNYQRARPLAENALEQFVQQEERLRTISTIGILASIAVEIGDLAEAHALAARARSVADELGTDYARGAACFASAFAEENPQQALALLEEGLTHWKKAGVPRRIWVHHLMNIGWYAIQTNELARARAALEEFLADPAFKTPMGIMSAQSNLGLVALHEGDRNGAAELFRQALQSARESGAKPNIAELLCGLATVAAIDGQPERAVRLIGAWETVHEAMGAPASPIEQSLVKSSWMGQEPA